MTQPRGLRTIAEPEALALVATATVGRLAHLHEDRIAVTPVNFLLERRDVLMRTADGAELLEAARHGAAAVLEVDDLIEWSRSGWSVLVSDSQKGDNNKFVELVTTLQDAQIAKILKAFSEQHGVTVTALE